MVNRKIMRDIKKILVLAQRAHAHLQKNKIPKAKRELRRIIKFDLDELSRLQKEHGDKKLLEECSVIFRDAKKALRDLDSAQLFDEAKELVAEIAKLEGHELMEVEEDEKEENEIYHFWHDTVLNLVVYHGTSSLSIPKIKRYGLVSSMKPDYYEKFSRLHQLYEKAGIQGPLNLGHGSGGREIGWAEFVKKGFFLTGKYNLARTHARPGPAIWHEFIEKNPNYEGAKLRFFEHAFFEWDFKNYTSSIYKYLKEHHDYNEAERIMKDIREKLRLAFKSNVRSAYDVIIRYSNEQYNIPKEYVCRLSKREINEILRLFEQLWLIFKDAHGVVLHISVTAPHLFVTKDGDNYVNKFDEFLEFYKAWNEGKSLEEGKAFVISVLQPHEKFVSRRIPAKYIVKIEEI
jgi:hypothetical protein